MQDLNYKLINRLWNGSLVHTTGFAEVEKKWLLFCKRHFQMHSLYWFWLKFNRSFFPNPIDSKSVFVRVLAWRRICDKRLHELNTSLFTEASIYVSPVLNMYVITVTSKWARWRLKSPTSRLCTQPFVQTQIKENIKAPRHWPLWGEFTGDRWIPRTKGQ